MGFSIGTAVSRLCGGAGMEFRHVPVLFNETMEALKVTPGGTYIDGTTGGEVILQEYARGWKEKACLWQLTETWMP